VVVEARVYGCSMPPELDLSDLTPLEGGWSGRTFLAESDGGKVVVRTYSPGGRPEVDAALLRRAADLVPVPLVLEVRSDRLVTSYVEGVRGDLLLPDLDDTGLATLGADVGRIVATLAAASTSIAGLFTDDLLSIEPFGLDLATWVTQHPRGWIEWPVSDRVGLMSLAEESEALLVAVGRTCLVHSDLNPKNLIVDPGTLEVLAVLDWEFAHSGSPYTDLGNTVRFERSPAWVNAVVSAYVDRLGDDASVAIDLARRADLWALVELAARRGRNPVADRAHDLLRSIASARDVHAWPTSWGGGGE
jgi:aminoglycoside phosphotransferase (APT) family kinase protein